MQVYILFVLNCKPKYDICIYSRDVACECVEAEAMNRAMVQEPPIFGLLWSKSTSNMPCKFLFQNKHVRIYI